MVKKAVEELRKSVYTALETYSNVHRGSGHYSLATTHLYEKARDIVLEHLKLDKSRYALFFLSPARADSFRKLLEPGCFQSISSEDIGLALGVCALVAERTKIPKDIPFDTGGGTARLVSPDWVVWSGVPERFEAGTPPIINAIAFARALQLTRKYGSDAFRQAIPKQSTAAEIVYWNEAAGLSGKELLEKFRQTLITHKEKVPIAGGEASFINLDNGASTPAFEPIWEAFSQTICQESNKQEVIIEAVKTICSDFLGAPRSEFDMIFVSNTTEAINLVAGNIARQARPGEETIVVNTYLEHNSNDLPWRMTDGVSMLRLPVDDDGIIETSELENLLQDYNAKKNNGNKRIRLLAVSGASNVLGTFNDLAEISRIAHQYGVLLFVDAAQLVAHRSINMTECQIDYLVFSAHKAYAPFGSGLLTARKDALYFTATELDYYRKSGEENAAGIAALGMSLSILRRIGMDLIEQEERTLTIKALKNLAEIPGIKIFGIKDSGSPVFNKKGGVIVFSLKGIMPDLLARRLAEQGAIGVRYGCHCSHLLVKRLLRVPPLLENTQRIIALLFPKVNFPGLTRISLGIENTGEDIETFINVLKAIVSNPRSSGKDIKQRMAGFNHEIASKVFE